MPKIKHLIFFTVFSLQYLFPASSSFNIKEVYTFAKQPKKSLRNSKKGQKIIEEFVDEGSFGVQR